LDVVAIKVITRRTSLSVTDGRARKGGDASGTPPAPAGAHAFAKGLIRHCDRFNEI
jgi:hypothetical protein